MNATICDGCGVRQGIMDPEWVLVTITPKKHPQFRRDYCYQCWLKVEKEINKSREPKFHVEQSR